MSRTQSHLSSFRFQYLCFDRFVTDAGRTYSLGLCLFVGNKRHLLCDQGEESSGLNDNTSAITVWVFVTLDAGLWRLLCQTVKETLWGGGLVLLCNVYMCVVTTIDWQKFEISVCVCVCPGICAQMLQHSLCFSIIRISLFARTQLSNAGISYETHDFQGNLFAALKLLISSHLKVCWVPRKSPCHHPAIHLFWLFKE